MQLTDFSIKEVVAEITESMRRERGDFVHTDPRVWLAAFKIDGEQRVAVIRFGHWQDVAPEIPQLDIQLRINEEEFEQDSFIPEATAADILVLITPEVVKRMHF
jgi:hypothetical protein